MRMVCPHCGTWARCRDSLQLTDTSRQSTHQCMNVECGHTFVAVSTINHTLSPSAMPNPRVILPLSSHIRRPVLAHQLAAMPSAEHQPTSTAARAMTRDLFEAPPPAG
ncbi:transcriptional regulator [Paracidovorax avenae]|uniref:ogr/Delta-like zinc finger family protein n=1 Tax=Paracidovorax avenae TaxID=80867 RepID=UPI000D22981B|nr:ogr/Delta-like zinc finger family protein [Paracidovorax avenae]AVS66624.1 transcriptional regulator [Paracidovorax avenae]